MVMKLKCLGSDRIVQQKDVSPKMGSVAQPSSPLLSQENCIFYSPEFYYDRFLKMI